MLQQSSQHQRIGGGAPLGARVRSRASSIASGISAAGSVGHVQPQRRVTELNLSGLKTEVGAGSEKYADDDVRSNFSGEGSVRSARSAAPAAVTLPPVGFPPRPAQYARDRNASLWKTEEGSESASSTDARMPNFEPPTVSLVYPGNKCADFNPWMGNGPEDILSEQTVKSGFLNKPTITNESNTARPVIWGPLKHKSGLQTLSSLFVAILEKRQGSGRLNTSSTFKPPPRVSLTNTKREAWLSDLANPACALRRFNRTIPYGINGKGLLEQCLAKEIPTARAIWLAKCIGANELRTLKRKGVTGALGVSAELKWVREWTMHVEQFIEATINNRAEANWKERVQYVVRLTYHLYVEQLLDQEHFLDWVMASFEGSNIERMPLWLVHVQLYWRFLVSTRKRGRRLAEALCASLTTIDNENRARDLLAPIGQRLRLLISTLASSHTACLVMPKSWSKYEKIVRNMNARLHLASTVAQIVERNNRLSKPLWEQSPRSTVSPKRRAFIALDEAPLDLSIPELSARLYELLPSTDAVVKVVLEWCSSPYRQGTHRVYLASRILRRFGLSGADIESYVLSFLMDPPATANIVVENIIKVVAELVRAKSFAVLKVLRAVIARGAMSDNQHNPQSASRLRQLVRGIPTAGLPQHVGDLQRNLLREAVSPPRHKIDVMLQLKGTIMRTVFAPNKARWTPRENEVLHSLSVAQKFELSAFIRIEVLKRSKAAFNIGGAAGSSEDHTLTPQTFAAARDVLEKVEDFPLLADIVGVCLRQSNGEMLAAVVDTIHNQHKTFASIGALRPLSTQAIERYHVFRNEVPLEKIYLVALIGLLKTTKGDASLIQRLQFDLTRCDQRNALAMCSPASDNILDPVSTASLDTEEEIERILSSGTTMDERSITRVFQRITSHLTNDLLSSGKTRARGEWFAKLRSFDELSFDAQMNEWLNQVLRVGTDDVCCFVLPFLIGAGALTFSTVAQTDQLMRPQIEKNKGMRLKMAITMLTVQLMPPTPNDAEPLDQQYRFKLLQADYARDNVEAVLRQVGNALSLVDVSSMAQEMETLREILHSVQVRDFLLRCAIEHKKPLQENVMSVLGANPAGTVIFKDIVEDLLDSQGQFSANMPNQEKIPKLVKTVGELSLPLCQLEMQLLLNTGSTKASEGGMEMAGALYQAIMSSPDSERPPWLDLVEGLDPSLLQRLRAIAEMQVLKIVDDLCKHIKTANMGGIDQMQMLKARALIRRLLYVVDCTVISQQNSAATAEPPKAPAATPSEAPEPHDRFTAVRDILARHFVPDPEARLPTRMAADLTCIMLNGLLHLLLVRKLAHPGSPSATGTHADVAILLPILLQIFASPSLTTSKSTVEFLYDTAAYLSDDLTDEARATLVKNEGPKYNHDSRINFILGPQPGAADAWLGLVTSSSTLNPLLPGGANVSNPASATPMSIGAAAQNAARQFGAPRVPNFSSPSPLPPRPGQPALQRQMSGPPGSIGGGTGGLLASLTGASLKSFNAPMPYHLRRWEMLPDPGTGGGAMGGMANDTAISLGLLGARRV